ncbi:ribonuclease P protein component [Tessaracoccus terricola]
MLPKDRRLTRPGEFTGAFRSAARAGTPSVVVHMHRLDNDPPESTRVGFVVSKKVGNAVVRNRVKRRLRHLAAGRTTPFAADVVVRALPPAAAEPERLVADFESAWSRAERKAH